MDKSKEIGYSVALNPRLEKKYRRGDIEAGDQDKPASSERTGTTREVSVPLGRFDLC